MAKKKSLTINQELNDKCDKFRDKMNSDMHYLGDKTNTTMSFDWVDEIEYAVPYLDNIIRNPKVALIKEEDVVKIEKAKKTSVASIKNLSLNTRYIDEIDENGDVKPSQILIERSEETFNIYENKFVYTLLNNLTLFVLKKEKILDDFETENDKVLEYAASTIAGKEKINIELKICSKELPDDLADDEFQKRIDEIRKRVKRIKEFLASWTNSELVKSLVKANVPFLIPPIKKTNVILKNPNFQVAEKLWNFLQRYDDPEDKNPKDSLDTEGDNLLKGLMDDAFLMNFYVLDTIGLKKREQKQRLAEYALVMIRQQIKRLIQLLLNCGIEVSDEEIMELILNELKREKNKTAVDSSDIKNKFKSAFDEYLDKTQNYM